MIKIINKESKGVLITLIISFLVLYYGFGGIGIADELLSTMVMGIIVVNFNIQKIKYSKCLNDISRK